MNEQEPSNSATPNVFSQVEKIFIDSEVDNSSDFLEFDMMILQSEAKVIDSVVTRLPKYADILIMIKNNQMPLTEAVSIVDGVLNLLPTRSEVHKAYISLRQILFVIAQLASESDMQEMLPEHHLNCREYQLMILFDNNIDEDDKIGLIQATRTLLNGEGIDTSNADDVLLAINQRDLAIERTKFEHDMRVKATGLFEDYLNASYTLAKADPEYRHLISVASRFVATQVVSTVYEDPSAVSTGTFAFELLIGESVSALGLNMTDIVSAFLQIVNQLVNEHKL